MQKSDSNIFDTISNDQLLKRARSLANEERRITLELIDHLKEIESRMLFLELGYGSLFDFAVRELGLSEGSAHRRISAMRLVQQNPQAAEDLKTGALSISNAAKIHVTFRKTAQKTSTKIDNETKTKIIQECLNTSQRECETKLFEMLPGSKTLAHQEQSRRVGVSQLEIKLVLDKDLQDRVQKLLALKSHTNPERGIHQLFDKLVTQELNRMEKKKGISAADAIQTDKAAAPAEKPASTSSSPTPLRSKSKQNNRINVPTSTQRQIWPKAEAKCEFISVENKRCGSTYQLQIDHIQPVAKNGSNEAKNLRLLCRKHNQYFSKLQFG